jgi:hypothetical protein
MGMKNMVRIAAQHIRNDVSWTGAGVVSAGRIGAQFREVRKKRRTNGEESK